MKIKTLQGAGKETLGVVLMKDLELICTMKMLCQQELTGNRLYWVILVLNCWVTILYFFPPKNSEFHSGVEMTLKINEILL